MTKLTKLLDAYPDAVATLHGSAEYSKISGLVRLYQTERGVLVATEVDGLPYEDGLCEDSIYALHIHQGESCSGNEEDPFAEALTHYNPGGCLHPYHAGDLPPLFGNKGYAMSVTMTNRFTVKEVVGRTVIVHKGLDDFTSQPAGNAGDKIACGQIKLCRLQ